MASFRKYKGAHLKPRGGARRRGARQQGGHTHALPAHVHYVPTQEPGGGALGFGHEGFTYPTSISGVYMGGLSSDSPAIGSAYDPAIVDDFDGISGNVSHEAGAHGGHTRPIRARMGSMRRRGAAAHGGSHNGCGPGMTMNGAGSCVPNGGMRRRGAKAHTPGHNGNGSCPAGMHMMPNGTCMAGSYHGASAGQGGGYRRNRPAKKRAPRRRR